MVSKAFFKSRNTTRLRCLLSIFQSHSFVTSSKAVSVENLGLKPDCDSVNKDCYLGGCLCKNRPPILLRKFDFSHELEFRSHYLVNHLNEFYLIKNSNRSFLRLIEVRSARHKLHACRNWKLYEGECVSYSLEYFQNFLNFKRSLVLKT